MKIDIIRHSEWAGTKFTLHLLSQILGKIKLETAQQEPQWAHVALDLTPVGFSTGLLFTQDHVFQADVDIQNSRIQVNVDGDIHSISLEPSRSVKWYHDEIFSALSSRGIDLKINPKPQEMAYTAPLNEDDAPLEFDQQMIEYGFWLGDEQTDIPAFFVLPYPFQYKDLNSPSIKPAEAFYDETKSEYFFLLDAVAAKENPSDDIQQFFRSTFCALAAELDWKGSGYYFTPLQMKEQASGKRH